MTLHEHVLDCTPVPLAGYLKALGIFRLVAEQKDAKARGCWHNERFVLRTELTEDELVSFFAESYKPSPIISPWNGRAGFLEDEESERSGAKLVMDYVKAADRFGELRDAVKSYRSDVALKVLKNFKSSKPKSSAVKDGEEGGANVRKRLKSAAIASLRSKASDRAIEWFDACLRTAADGAKMSPLLGDGGADGSRDFGVNFGTALSELFSFETGLPCEGAVELIRGSLGFREVPSVVAKGNLGLYEPVGGAVDITMGFEVKGTKMPLNPVDAILLLEGVLLFSGAITRRLGNNETQYCFPFTVSALTAGSGAVAGKDDLQHAEFWAPIWDRPAGLDELSVFLREGRAIVNRKGVGNALEFAVATKNLGVQRGVPEFQRFALLVREPQSPRKATPISRVRVRENQTARLVAELDKWFSRNRKALRGKEAPAYLGMISREMDAKLHRLTDNGLPTAVQDVLIALGRLMTGVARRPKFYADGKFRLPKPLHCDWVEKADDQSHEFALAAALASLAMSSGDFRMIFRNHLVPIEVGKDGTGSWGDTGPARSLVVWTGRDLIRDMGYVLERRMIEAQRRDMTTTDGNGKALHPLYGYRPAPLEAVTSFLAGETQDDKIASLAAGLAWVNIRRGFHPEDGKNYGLPLAYASLKVLFSSEGLKGRAGDGCQCKLLPLVRLLRAGRVPEAVSRALRMARNSGLPSPYIKQKIECALKPDRLTAALLFPIAKGGHSRLRNRAYPGTISTNEEDHHDT